MDTLHRYDPGCTLSDYYKAEYYFGVRLMRTLLKRHSMKQALKIVQSRGDLEQLNRDYLHALRLEADTQHETQRLSDK